MSHTGCHQAILTPISSLSSDMLKGHLTFSKTQIPLSQTRQLLSAYSIENFMCIFFILYNFLENLSLLTSKHRQANINKLDIKVQTMIVEDYFQNGRGKIDFFFTFFLLPMCLCKILFTGQIESMNIAPIYKISLPIIALM